MMMMNIHRDTPSTRLFERGVMVIVAGYGHGDTSSKPGRD